MKTEIKVVRPISTIAYEIEEDWGKQKGGVSPYARQQLDAMYSLDKITDNYYYDSGAMVVGSFLANCSRWKGDKARAIKKELKEILKMI